LEPKKPTKAPASTKPAGAFSVDPQELGSHLSQADGALRTLKTETSKYDAGFLITGQQPLVELNEQRALRQTPGDKVKNGLVKMAGTAATSFLEPFVDLTVGAATAATTEGDAGAKARGFYDNVGTQALDGLNEYLQKEYPHYYSQKEAALNPLAQLGTVNFWADKVGGGVGFMLGAVASGMLTGGAADALKAGRVAKGLAAAAELAGDVSKGVKEGQAILAAVGQAAGAANRGKHLSNFATGLVGAMGESGMEARQIAKETGIAVRKQLLLDKGLDPNTYEEHVFSGDEEARIKDLEEAAGNTGFAYNLALVGGNNALLLPKIFRKGYQAERVVAGELVRDVETGLYQAAELTARQKLGKALRKVGANNLEEATQEQLQFALEKALPDYYRKQRDPQATATLQDYLSSMGQGLSEAYGTKEGWENALLGGLIGLAGAKGSLQEVTAEDRAAKAAADTVNAAIATKGNQAMVKALVGQLAYDREGVGHTVAGNRRRAEDAAFGSFASLVRGYSLSGRLDDLVEDIRKSGQLTPEEFKAQSGLAEQAELRENPVVLASKQEAKVRELHRLSQDIEEAYPAPELEPLRDALFGISAQVQNSEGRERKMAAEIAQLTGISLDALRLAQADAAPDALQSAVEAWAAKPGRNVLYARRALEKARDIKALAEERVFLAELYQRLEDPAYREQAFSQQEALNEAVREEVTVAKAQAAALPLTEQPAPVTEAAAAAAEMPAPAGDADFFAAASFDDGSTPAPTAVIAPITPAAAPVAAAPGKTYDVPVSAAEGAPEDLVATLDGNGQVVGMKWVHNGQALSPAKLSALAANLQPALAAKFAALGISVPAATTPAVPAEQQAVLDKLAILAQEGGPALAADQRTYVNAQGQPFMRASGIKEALLKGRRKTPESKDFLDDNPQYGDRGNVADLIIRDFFIADGQFTDADAKAVYAAYLDSQKGRTHRTKGTPSPATVQLTDSFFAELLDNVRLIKAKLDAAGFKVFSDTPTLYGQIDGKPVAGTMDLVAVGPQGGVYIVDIKTSNKSRRADYRLPDRGEGALNRYGTEESSEYREGDLIQQSIYVELLKQRTGLDVKDRLIFPIIAKVSANAATAATLEPDSQGQYAMSLNAQGALGQLDINGLIKHYTGGDNAPTPAPKKTEAPTTVPAAPAAAPRLDAYATATEDGKLSAKQVTPQPIGNMPLALQVDGNVARVYLNPAAQQDLQQNGTRGLQEFFADTPLPVPNRGAFTYEVEQPATLRKTAGGWEVEAKGRLGLKYANAAAAPVAEQEESHALEQLNTFISKTEDLAAAPAYQAWKADVLADAHREDYYLVWDGGKQYNVYTTHGGKQLHLGYLNGAKATSDSATFQGRVAATDAFKKLIAATYPKGQKVALNVAVNAYGHDNVQTTPGADSPSLADLDGRYQYQGRWQAYSIRKPGSDQQAIRAVLGTPLSAQDEADIERRLAAGNTDGYLLKVSKPGGDYDWVGLNTKPVADQAYAGIFSALAGKEPDAQLGATYFAAALLPNTHLKFYEGSIQVLSDDATVKEPLGYLIPKKEAGPVTDRASFLANLDVAGGLRQTPIAGILGNVSHELSPSLSEAQKLALLVPNTSRELWRTFTVTPVSTKGDGTAAVMETAQQLNTAVDAPVAADLAQDPDARQELKQADVQQAGVRPNYRELDAGEWTEEEEDAFAEEQRGKRSPKWGEQDADYQVLLPDNRARLDALARLQPTNWKRAAQRLSAILPAGISVKNIQDLATRYALTGREVGAALRDAVYLADNTLEGTEWHEAFHILQSAVFTAEENARVNAIGKSRTDLSPAAVRAFKAEHPEYAAYGPSKLREQMVRETLANAYQDYRNERPGILARLWKKLQEFLGFVRREQDELLDLFAQIDRGGFKHRKLRLSDRTGAEFKSLPYAAVMQSDKIVKLLTARLWHRLEQRGLRHAPKATREAVLEELIRERLLEDKVPLAGLSGASAEQQHLRPLTKEERAQLGAERGHFYREVYLSPDGIQAIKEQANHYWSYIGADTRVKDEDNADGWDPEAEDDNTDRNFDQGIMEVDPLGDMEGAVKLFIAFTTYGSGKDEQTVDYVPTVGLMLRNLENLRSLDAMRQKLRDVVALGDQPQLAAVVERLEAAFTGPTGAFFGPQFFRAFSKQYLPSDTMLVNEVTGETQLTSSDQNGLDVQRVGQFYQNLENISVARRQENLDALAKTIKGLRREATPEGIQDLITQLPGIGLDLHPGFVKSVAAGQDAVYKLDYENADTKDGGKNRSLLADIGGIAARVREGHNPFVREDEGADAVSRAKALATQDALWQPNLANGSYSADGKPQFSYVNNSYVLERGRDIQDGKVSFASPVDQLNPLVKAMQADPEYAKRLKLRAYGGVRPAENGEGKSFKKLDPKSYLVGVFGLFRKGRLQFTQFEAKSSTLTLTLPSAARNTQADGTPKPAALQMLRAFYQQDLLLNEQVLQKLEAVAAEPDPQRQQELLNALEMTHDFKKYDAQNRPVLTTREQVAAAYNQAPGAARDKAIAALPRGLQLVQLPGLNALTLDQRQDEQLVGKLIQQELDRAHAQFMQVLAENELDPNNAVTRLILMDGVSPDDYAGVSEYAKEFLLTDFLYRNAYSQLQRGTEAHFKNAIDITKRAAGMLAAGPSAGKGSYKFAVLATDSSFLDKQTLQLVDQAGENTHTNDDTDASGHMTDVRFQDLLQRLGKSSPEIHAQLQALVDGEENVQWRPDNGWVANTLKNVVFGPHSPYVKTATQPMFVQDLGMNMGQDYVPAKGQLSYTSPNGNVWVADPSSERLFQLFVQMKEQGIAEAYHDTAVKEKLQGQNFRGADGRFGQGGVLTAQEIPNADWRLQMENPSGKQKIVHGTQLLALLDTNMVDTDEISYRGTTKSVKQWRSERQALLAAIVETDADKAFAALDVVIGGNNLFAQAIQDSLEASGADQNTLDFFSTLADGSWRYSTDLPNVQAKFQQLWLSYFNKGVLAQKVPGLKATLLPSSMRRVVVRKADGLPVHDFGKGKAQQEYLDANGLLKDEYTTRPLKMHGPIRDETGNVVGIDYAEVILSEEFLVQHNLTKEQLYANDIPADVRENLLTMLGFRIPTQAHHSMLPFKVVGWLPAYMGSVAVTPAGVTYLSGADYDVDSIYIMRKAFYADKTGVHLYGSQAADDVAGRWKEYLKYEEANNKAYKTAKRTLLAQNPEYQVLKKSASDVKAALKGMASAEQQAGEIDELTDAIVSADVDGTDAETVASFKDARLDAHVGIANYRRLEASLLGLRDKLQALEAAATQAALTALQQPATLEQFSALPQDKQLSNYARNNAVLDQSLALLMNPHNWEAMRTPASTERGNDVIKVLGKAAKRSFEGSAPYNHLLTQFQHWWANSAGKSNLGIAALANTGVGFVTKAGAKIEQPLYFFGKELTGFDGLQETDIALAEKDGKLVVTDNGAATAQKFDTLSLLVSMMADNAKEQGSARGNMAADILGKMAAACGLGSGFNRSMLMNFQPVMWEFSKRVAALDNEWGEKKSSGKVLKELQQEIAAFFNITGRGDDLIKLANQAIGEWQPTAQQAADALAWRMPAAGTKLEELSKADIAHLKTQWYTLVTYQQLNAIAGDLQQVSTGMGLTKGLGASLQDVDNVTDAISWATGGPHPTNPFAKTTVEILSAFPQEKLFIANWRVLGRLNDALPGVFLTRTEAVQSLLKKAQGLMRGLKADDVAKLEGEYLTWLNINAFQTELATRNGGKRLADFQYLLTDKDRNITALLTSLRAAVQEDGTTLKYPELRTNPLLRALSVQRPGKGNKFYGLTFNSRNKADATFTEKQTDAFVELLSSEHKEVADLANKLVLFLALKHNFQFRNASFIKVLPALKMTLPSEQLKKVAAAVRSGDDNAVKALTGYGLRAGFRQFLGHYFSNPDNRPFLKDKAKGELPAFYQGRVDMVSPDGVAPVFELLADDRYRVLPVNYNAKQQTPYHLDYREAVGGPAPAKAVVAQVAAAEATAPASTTAAPTSAVQAALAGEEEMTPFVADLLNNWEDRMQPALHGLATADRLALAKDIENGTATTTCLL
jgi:hypothetical protein